MDAHINHCFDALRQHIQCAAPDDLLYTHRQLMTGDGQVRQCRDWDYLRKWAADHTTCNYASHEQEPILSQYDACLSESDGLPPDIN